MTAMELTAAEAWSRILERARAQLPEQIYRSWLEQTEPVALSQDQLAIATHNEFAAEWIEKHYANLLTQAAERLFGRRFTLAFQHQPPPDGAVSTAQRRTASAMRPLPQAGSAVSAGAAAAPPGPTVLGASLNERYTFERFVVGSNNQLAAAACRAVAETPARMYNPLFIYGGVGLGKTHLMHAIGHAVLARLPDRRVAYVSTQRLNTDLIGVILVG